jgi:hypothetical protein
MWDKTGSVFFVAAMKGRISLFEGSLNQAKMQPVTVL